MKVLYLITARGGSKGIPGKNTKPLNGKPLIYYTLEVARQLSNDKLICVSTDSEEIANTVKQSGLEVPFIRPAHLATDTAGSDGVIEHALTFYESQNIHPDVLVLLQPTSPFRNAEHVKEALKLFTGNEDMVVAVKESKANPYFTLLEENTDGYLEKSKKLPQAITRRQDSPPVYEINGAIYIINVKAFKQLKSLAKFTKLKKYIMSQEASLDLDTLLDWKLAELILNEKQ